jgi:hypothetical protein
MLFSKVLTFALAGFALAAPFENSKAKRDLSLIETDLSTISNQLIALDTKLVAFTGNLLDGLTIYSGILTLEKQIQTATTDVIANGALTIDESAILSAYGEALTSQLGGILNDIIAKVTVIKGTGLTSLILSVLANVKVFPCNSTQYSFSKIEAPYSQK